MNRTTITPLEPGYRIKLVQGEDEDPVFERALLQQRRWWGWKTVDWNYTHPIEDVIDALSARVDEFEEELKYMSISAL